MTLLLGCNLEILISGGTDFGWGVGGNNLVGGGDEQIFDWWRGDSQPIPSSRENPGSNNYENHFCALSII